MMFFKSCKSSEKVGSIPGIPNLWYEYH